MWLGNLPRELTEAAAPLVKHAAETTFSESYSSYPVVTGNLRGGLVIVDNSTAGRAAFVVSNRAPHAYVYENGTEVRRTDLGYDRGRMPARPTLNRIGDREGQYMKAHVNEMVRQAGFELGPEY